MAKIIDEFTNLPVSRERKRQLRALKKGRCSKAGCKRKLFGNHFCKLHTKAHNTYYRERARKLKGSTRTYRTKNSFRS